jgi:photosystem II stability/assembly factor-like uncharacterized protein
MKYCYTIILLIILFSCKSKKWNATVNTIESSKAYDWKDMVQIDQNTLIAVGGIKYNVGAALVSKDNGATWQLVDSISPWRLQSIAKSWNNKLYTAGIGGKIFHSTTLFSNYDSIQTADTNGEWQDINTIALLSDNTMVIGGGLYKGVCYSSPNIDATALTSIDQERMINDIEMLNPSTGYACSNGQALKTKSSGNSWTVLNVTGDNFIALDFLDESTGFMIGYNGSIYKTTNSGAKWEQLRNGNSLFNGTYRFRDIAMVNSSVGYIACDNGIILKTLDGGNYWQAIEPFSQADLFKIKIINEKNIWVLGSRGSLYNILEL